MRVLHQVILRYYVSVRIVVIVYFGELWPLVKYNTFMSKLQTCLFRLPLVFMLDLQRWKKQQKGVVQTQPAIMFLNICIQ